jgi:hypothetical protein
MPDFVVFYDDIEDVDQAHAALNTSTDKEQIAKAVTFIAENTPGVGAEAIDPLGSTAFQLGYLQSTLACTNKKLAELEKIVSLVKGLAYNECNNVNTNDDS